MKTLAQLHSFVKKLRPPVSVMDIVRMDYDSLHFTNILKETPGFYAMLCVIDLTQREENASFLYYVADGLVEKHSYK